jgi:hypothetical protein
LASQRALLVPRHSVASRFTFAAGAESNLLNTPPLGNPNAVLGAANSRRTTPQA